jgi:hypothetical protein
MIGVRLMANGAALGHDASPGDNERVSQRGAEKQGSERNTDPSRIPLIRVPCLTGRLGDWATTLSARRYWLSILTDWKAGRNRFLENTAFSDQPDLQSAAIFYHQRLDLAPIDALKSQPYDGKVRYLEFGTWLFEFLCRKLLAHLHSC